MDAEIAALVCSWLWLGTKLIAALLLAALLSLILFVVLALVWWMAIRVQPPVPGVADGYQQQHFSLA